MLYKFCDAFAGNMTAPFVIDLGFSRNDYAAIVKGVGLAATLVGGFAGGAVAMRYDLLTCLWIGAILQMASNLVFTWLAFVGINHWALTAAIIAENFTGAIGTVIFVAYLSALCQSPLHTATQFALLTALAAVGRTYFRHPPAMSPKRPAGRCSLCSLRCSQSRSLYPARLAAAARAFRRARAVARRPRGRLELTSYPGRSAARSGALQTRLAQPSSTAKETGVPGLVPLARTRDRYFFGGNTRKRSPRSNSLSSLQSGLSQ